jgi:hypothetical protein
LPGESLDVELMCTAGKCAVDIFRVRINDGGPGWLMTLRDRIWRCPACGQQATLKWVQMAEVTHPSERVSSSDVEPQQAS